MSRSELYVTSLEITGKMQAPELLPESDIYYDGCIKVKIFGQNNTLEATGFGGMKAVYDFEPQNLQAEMENKGRHFTSDSGTQIFIFKWVNYLLTSSAKFQLELSFTQFSKLIFR